MKTILAITFVLSVTFLHAQDEPVDGPKKTIIYQFTDLSPVEAPNDKAKKAPAQERFEYLSTILPTNLKRDIESSGKFVVEIIPSKIEWLDDATDVDTKLDVLAETAKKNEAQFVVFGSFSVVQSRLAIKVHVFSNRAKKIIPVSIDKEKVGVMFDSIITELSSRSASEMERYILKRAEPPLFIPEENSFNFFKEISLKPANEGDEIWYTTDGSEPSREEGALYKNPVTFRKSSRIRAVTYHEGLYVSKPVDKNVTITYPLSRFTIGHSFGSTIFLGETGKHTSSPTNNLTTFFVQWEFANISRLQEIPLIKNMGLIASFDSGRGEDKNSSSGSGKGGGYVMSVTLGPVYTFRLADFLSADFGIVAGYAHLTHFQDSKGNGWKDIFNIPPKSGDTLNRPGYGAISRLNFIWGHLFLHADAGYRLVFMNDDHSSGQQRLHMLLLGTGVGWRF
jgi:hypothetical protein